MVLVLLLYKVQVSDFSDQVHVSCVLPGWRLSTLAVILCVHADLSIQKSSQVRVSGKINLPIVQLSCLLDFNRVDNHFCIHS